MKKIIYIATLGFLLGVTGMLVSDPAYYRQVRLNSNPYSAISSFSLATSSLSTSAEIIAYPNPVNFSNGKQINFSHLPNSSVELTVHTISGETVLHNIGLLDSWQWYGSNAASYTVTAGTYLWYLQIDDYTYFRKIVIT